MDPLAGHGRSSDNGRKREFFPQPGRERMLTGDPVTRRSFMKINVFSPSFLWAGSFGTDGADRGRWKRFIRFQKMPEGLCGMGWRTVYATRDADTRTAVAVAGEAKRTGASDRSWEGNAQASGQPNGGKRTRFTQARYLIFTTSPGDTFC